MTPTLQRRDSGVERGTVFPAAPAVALAVHKGASLDSPAPGTPLDGADRGPVFLGAAP